MRSSTCGELSSGTSPVLIDEAKRSLAMRPAEAMHRSRCAIVELVQSRSASSTSSRHRSAGAALRRAGGVPRRGAATTLNSLGVVHLGSRSYLLRTRAVARRVRARARLLSPGARARVAAGDERLALLDRDQHRRRGSAASARTARRWSTSSGASPSRASTATRSTTSRFFSPKLARRRDARPGSSAARPGEEALAIDRRRRRRSANAGASCSVARPREAAGDSPRRWRTTRRTTRSSARWTRRRRDGRPGLQALARRRQKALRRRVASCATRIGRSSARRAGRADRARELRAFDVGLDRRGGRAAPAGRSPSRFRLDYFKSINDRYTHAAGGPCFGRWVLRAIAGRRISRRASEARSSRCSFPTRTGRGAARSRAGALRRSRCAWFASAPGPRGDPLGRGCGRCRRRACADGALRADAALPRECTRPARPRSSTASATAPARLRSARHNLRSTFDERHGRRSTISRSTTSGASRSSSTATRARCMLIVNTASKCGFTPQYKGLERSTQIPRIKGLEVLGFPCNQFGEQEPGSEKEIATFCEVNYGVTFPMFSKVDVNGERGAAVQVAEEGKSRGCSAPRRSSGTSRSSWSTARATSSRATRRTTRRNRSSATSRKRCDAPRAPRWSRGGGTGALCAAGAARSRTGTRCCGLRFLSRRPASIRRRRRLYSHGQPRDLRSAVSGTTISRGPTSSCRTRRWRCPRSPPTARPGRSASSRASTSPTIPRSRARSAS